jgi:hypothetical protein
MQAKVLPYEYRNRSESIKNYLNVLPTVSRTSTRPSFVLVTPYHTIRYHTLPYLLPDLYCSSSSSSRDKPTNLQRTKSIHTSKQEVVIERNIKLRANYCLANRPKEIRQFGRKKETLTLTIYSILCNHDNRLFKMRTINNKQKSYKTAAPTAPAAPAAPSTSASATPSPAASAVPSPAEPEPVPSSSSASASASSASATPSPAASAVPSPAEPVPVTSSTSTSSSVKSSSKNFVANVHSSTSPVFGTSSVDGIENNNTNNSNSNNQSNNANRGEEIVSALQPNRQKQQQQEQDFAVDDDDDDDDDDDHKSSFSWTGSDLDDDVEDEFIDDSTRFSTSVLGGDRSNISSNNHHRNSYNSGNDNEIKPQQQQQQQVDDQRDDGDNEIEQQQREESTIDIRDPVTPSGINDIAWSGSDLEDDCDENIVDSCHIIGTTNSNGLVTDDSHADTGRDSAAAAVTGRDSAAAAAAAAAEDIDTDDSVIAWSKSDFDEDDDDDVVDDDGDIAIKNLKDSINISNNSNGNIQIKDIAFLDDDVQNHSSASSVSVTARTTTTILDSIDEDGKLFDKTSSSSVTNRTGNSNTNHTYRTTGQHSATTAAMTNVTLMAQNDTDDANNNNDGNESLLEMSKSTHNNKINGHVASNKEDSNQDDDNDDDHQTAYEEDLLDAFFENIHDRICKETSNSRGGKQIMRRRCNGVEEEEDDDVTVQDALFCKLLLDPMLDHLEKYDPVFEKLEELACPEDDDDDDKTEISNVEGVGIVDLDELSTMVCATTAAKAEDGTAAPVTNYAAIAFSQLLDRVERFDPYFERCTERMEEVFNSNDKKTNHGKEVNVDQQYSPRSISSKATAASKISIDVLDKAFERAESMLKKQKQKAKIQKITGKAFERAELMLKKQKERWFVARVNWKLRQSVFSEAIKVNTKKCTEQTTKLVNECAAATITPATAAAAARAVVASATKCNDTTTDHRQTVTGKKKMDKKNKMETKNSTSNPLKVEPPKNQLKSTNTEDGNESAVTDMSYSDHVVRSQVGLSPGSSAGPSDEEEVDAETNFSEYDDDDTNTTMTGFLSESVVAGTTTGSLFVITEDVPVTESMVTCTSNMNKNEAKDGDSKKGNMTPSTPSSPLRRWAYPSPLPSPRRRRCRKNSSASDNTPFAWLGQWRDSVESVSKKILDRTPSCSSTSIFFEDNDDNDLEKENSLIDHDYVGYVGYVGGSRDIIKVKEAVDGNDDDFKEYDYDDDLSGFETAIDYDQQVERHPMPRLEGSRSSLLTENDYQQQDQDELHPMLRLQRSRDSLSNENDYQQDHQDERPPMLRLQRSRNSRGDHVSLSSMDCDTATMKSCVSDYSRLSSLNGGAARVVKDKIGYSLADSIRDASMTARNRDLRKKRMSREPRGNKLTNEPSTHIHTISDQQRIRSPRSSETQITADLTATSGGSSELLVTAIDESDNISTKSSMIGYVKNLYHASKKNAAKTDGKEEDIRRQRNDNASEHGSVTSGIPSTSSTHTSAFMDCYEDEVQSNGYSMTSDMLSMATGLMSMTTDMMLNYNSSSKLSSSSNINRADNKNTDNNNNNNNNNSNSSNNNNNKEETESKIAPIATLPIEDDIPSDNISTTTDMSMTTDMMLAYWNTSNGNNRDDDGELNLKPEPAPETKALTSPSSPTQTMTSTRTTMVYLEELIQSDATSPVKLVLYLAWLSVYYVIRSEFSTMVMSVGSINDEDKNTNTVTVKSEENGNNEKEKKIIDTATNTTACNDFKSDPAKNKKESKRHRRHRRRPQTVEDRRRRRIRATRNFGKVLAGEPEDLSLSMSMSTTFTSSEELSASSSSSILYDLAHHHVDNMPSKPTTKKALILYV